MRTERSEGSINYSGWGSSGWQIEGLFVSDIYQ